MFWCSTRRAAQARENFGHFIQYMIYVLYIKCTVYKVRDHQEVCLEKGKVFHDFQLIKNQLKSGGFQTTGSVTKLREIQICQYN